MAESVVYLALETFRDLLLEETRFLLGVRGEAKGLESRLKEMLCFLKDADKRQHESDSVVNWIAETRDLAYRAEDVIEAYAAHFSSMRKGGFWKLLWKFSCILKEGVTLHQTGSEISDIRSEIERVSKSMQDYGIRRIIQGGADSFSCENRRWRRQTFPFGIEDCFVGMENDLRRLISLVVEDRGHRVISIWGMGGKGKTTIARKVYNHIEIKHSFQCFAWICITQQCQISSVMEDVLKQLVPGKNQENANLSNTELIHQLCQVQKDKRCLIVLDDLWEIDHWEGLKHAFYINGLNSKILLTTRKKDIADVGFAYDLGLLNVDDGWELLKKKASPQNITTDFAMEENLFERIGKEMVRKCGYLPLCVSLLGGILSKKKSIKEWKLVNENMNAYLYRGEDIGKDNHIHGVLDLSYADLPSYLKPCFLLMGYFREDQLIPANDLYMMWIAQGMISKESLGNEDTLMDVAELYLSELASRCVVQVVPEDDAIVGKKYRLCQLHDTVRELCLLKGRKDDFRLNAIDHQNGSFSTMVPSSSGVKTRHLVVNFLGESGEKLQHEFASFWKEMNKDNHIRSLQFLVQYSPGRIVEVPRDFLDFGMLKLLRTLVLECFRFEGRKLPREIGNLIHLRYLRLYRCELDELPQSICHLKYLYSLDINGCQKTTIPNVLYKMHRLRHLILPFFTDVKGDQVQRLDGLDELETLSGFSSLIHDFQSISKMKNLRELHVLVYDNKSLSEIIDGVNTNWNNLRKSFVWIMDGCELSATEEKGLSILKKIFTCSNLHYLRIYVPIKKLKVEDIEMDSIFPGLVYLNLRNTAIEDDPMETLEKLPFLRRLILRKRSCVGEAMTCRATGFPKLKILELIQLHNLKAWMVEAGAMPCVSEILLDSCRRLRMIPKGFMHIRSLQKLEIVKMDNLGRRVSRFMEDGRREAADFYKVRHVPSIIIR